MTALNNKIKLLYEQLLTLPIQSDEYKKCISELRRCETGGQTLGLNTALEPITPPKDCVDINITILD